MESETDTKKSKNKGFKKARHVRLILFPCSLDMKSYANVCAARPAGVEVHAVRTRGPCGTGLRLTIECYDIYGKIREIQWGY